MKVKSTNKYPIALFDASFNRHVIHANAEYELPDGTDVSMFVDRGMMTVIKDGQQELLDTDGKDDVINNDDTDTDAGSDNQDKETPESKKGKK